MGISLRMELFPADMDRFLQFWTETLRFKLTRREKMDGRAGEYAHIVRDSVHVGVLTEMTEGGFSNDLAFGKPPRGVEIVIEVDDLEAERDHIVSKGCKLQAEIQTRSWGLTDFRLYDPDGYYLRITNRYIANKPHF